MAVIQNGCAVPLTGEAAHPFWMLALFLRRPVASARQCPRLARRDLG
jgi:hypothetical protein